MKNEIKIFCVLLISIVCSEPICRYTLDGNGLYTCFLEDGIVYYTNSTILGDHDPNEESMTDDDVVRLYTNETATEIILHLAFTSFKNLRIMEFESGIFKLFSPTLFFNCDKLEKFKIAKSTPLKTVPSNTFSNCTNIIELNLADNGISQLEHDSFAGLNNLTTLILKNNTLVTIIPKIFDNLSNLKILDISNNENLDSFDSGVFKNNKELEELLIANNKFELLKKEYFEGLTKLTKLDATNARVNKTQKEMFNNLTGLKIALFSSNSCIDKDFENFQSSDISAFEVCIKNYNNSNMLNMSRFLLLLLLIVIFVLSF